MRVFLRQGGMAAAGLIALLAGASPAFAQGGESHLKASVAGPASAPAGKPFQLLVSLEIADGYHIQSNRPKEGYIPTKVTVAAPKGFKVGAPAYPAAETVKVAGDEIPVFGGRITVKVPVTPPAGTKGKQSFKVRVSYQACNDFACFPPDEVAAEGSVMLGGSPPLKKKAEEAPPASAESVHLSVSAETPPGVGGRPFELTVRLGVKDGFHIQAVDAKPPYIPTELSVQAPEGYTVGKPVFPKSTTAMVAGETIPVYEGDVQVRVPIQPPKTPQVNPRFTVRVRYQACDANSCFPPEELVTGAAMQARSAGPRVPRIEGFAVSKIERFVGPDEFVQFLRTGETGASSSLTDLLAKNLLLALPVIFLLGLALNLTPCVYPIIPITIAYFGGQAGGQGHRPMVLAVFYVLGMAVMYSALGVIAGLTGGLFGAQLQNPWVLAGFALIMFALALSQFDRKDGTPIWEFQLPAGLRNKAQRKSGLVGAALMGLMVGVVAAPCIGPAVVALLQWVGVQRSPALGFAVFFTLALGLGLPYIFLAAVSGSVKKLPRSGEWMIGVKHIFGILMIFMGFYYLQTILNTWRAGLGTYALVAVAVIGGIYLLVFDRAGASARGFNVFRRALGAVAIAAGVWMARPAPAETIKWLPYDEKAIEVARLEGRRVLVDFTAEWCAQCKELEHKTFSHPTVGKEAGEFIALRADMTDFNGPQGRKWQEQYAIVGLPTVARLIPTGAPRSLDPEPGRAASR